MAKARVILPKDISRRAKLLVSNAIKKANIEPFVKKEFIKDIRSGNVPTERGWPPVTSKWDNRRERLKNAGQKTDRAYSSGANIATFSGEFLDKIKVSFIASKLTLNITPAGKHKGYINVRGGERTRSGRRIPLRGKSVSNAKIAEGLSDQGREVFVFSKRFRQKFIQEIKRIVKTI